MMQQIDRSQGARERKTRTLITVLIFLFAAAFGMLGGEWGQALAQTVPTLPPTLTSPPATQVPPGKASSTPTATFVIVPSPTSTPSQTATAAEPTETAVPSTPTSQAPDATPTDKQNALLSAEATISPQPGDQAGLEKEQWWQSPWSLAIGLLLLFAVIALIWGRKGVRDQSKRG